MSTTSTKSNRNQKTSDAKLSAPSASEEGLEISERSWRLSGAAILVVGAFLRLYHLSLVPLHHDEGVNGNFLVTLVREGKYVYNPENYHGPTLYYFSAIIPWITRFLGGRAFGERFGLTTFNIRLVTALFGIATIGLVLLLRKQLGTIGALTAAALIAISPGAVYLSRYYIHESLFVFFTLGIVVAAVKYHESGRAIYLLLGSISAALLVATKETWIINASVLVIAFIAAGIYLWIRQASETPANAIVHPGGLPLSVREKLVATLGYPISILALINLLREREDRFQRFHAFQSILLQLTFVLIESALAAIRVIPGLVGMERNTVTLLGRASAIASVIVLVLYLALLIFAAVKAFQGTIWLLPIIGRKAHEYSGRLLLARFGGTITVVTVALVALTIFIIINVLFYSSFFTNYPKGVRDAFQTLNLWKNRQSEHPHPFPQYFEWLRQMESPILLLGAVGAAIAVWRGNNRFALFVAQWGFGLLVAYSLVRYKTPWISLNFIVPIAIIGGYAVDQLYRRYGQPWVPLALIAGAIALLIYGRMAKLTDVSEGLKGGVTWDFDFSKHWLAIVGIGFLALYAGYVLYSRFDRNKLSPHFYVAAAFALVVLGYQMFQLNFIHYDDEQYVYVYAHTRRQTLAMVAEIDRVANVLKTGNDTGIAIVSRDYWPLPWYFRNYTRVGYYNQIVPTNEPVIIGSTVEAEQLKNTFGNRYQLVNSGVDDGAFALRPGVDLLLYVRKDIAR